MARLIEEFGTVRCIAAEPVNEEKALEWSNWRKDYIGRVGWLNFGVSEHKCPGKEFFYFFGGEESDKEWSLKSFVKQKDESQEKLVLITENSRYTFEILYKDTRKYVLQEWLLKYNDDLNKAYHALKDELEQFAEYEGAAALVDERGTELEALMQMEEMLGIKENEE